MRRGTAPTLQDVAKEAGVSAMAVSVVLNGARSGSRVSEATRTRIIEAAERLRYRPNAAARGLQRRRMDSLGVVAKFDGGTVNMYLLEVLSGILEAASARGQNTTVLSVTDWQEDERRVLQFCDGRVDGMVLIGPHLTPEFARSVQHHTPFVTIHASGTAADTWGIDVDNEVGSYLAARHLVEQGHRRILHLAGPLHLNGPRQRLAGYRRALEEVGVVYDPALVKEAGFDSYHAHALMRRLLEEGTFAELCPTALSCVNDAVAAGAIEVLTERGLRVPEDISVVGFDDAPVAQMTTPRLTSVRQPFPELGRRAVQMLLEQIDADAVPASAASTPAVAHPTPRTELLDVELVVRASVGSPPSVSPVLTPPV